MTALSNGSNGPTTVSFDDIIEEFTPDQLAKKLPLEASVVEWLKIQPEDPNDPLLVLDYQRDFIQLANFWEQKTALTALLLQHGAQRVADSEVVFKFVDGRTLDRAKYNILDAKPNLFHQGPTGHRAYWLEDVLEFELFSREPKIRTTIITSGHAGRFQFEQREFFEV